VGEGGGAEFEGTSFAGSFCVSPMMIPMKKMAEGTIRRKKMRRKRCSIKNLSGTKRSAVWRPNTCGPETNFHKK